MFLLPPKHGSLCREKLHGHETFLFTEKNQRDNNTLSSWEKIPQDGAQGAALLRGGPSALHTAEVAMSPQAFHTALSTLFGIYLSFTLVIKCLIHFFLFTNKVLWQRTAGEALLESAIREALFEELGVRLRLKE